MGNSEEKLDYYFKVLSNRIRRNILLLRKYGGIS